MANADTGIHLKDFLDATTVDACRLLNLPRFSDERGHLTFVEGRHHIPFPIARIFYLYAVPRESIRAGHALRTCAQLIVALNGSFDVTLKDGLSERSVKLSDPAQGLSVPPKVWREITNFSSGSVCLVIASEPYDEKAYYDFYEEYLEAVGRSR